MYKWFYVHCCLVSFPPSFAILLSQRGGGTIDLEPRLMHTLTPEPTLAPVFVERTMTTRAAASVLPSPDLSWILKSFSAFVEDSVSVFIFLGYILVLQCHSFSGFYLLLKVQSSGDGFIFSWDECTSVAPSVSDISSSQKMKSSLSFKID